MLGIVARSTGMIGAFANGPAARAVVRSLIAIGPTFGAVTTAGGPLATSAVARLTCETAPGTTAAETAAVEASPFETFPSAAIGTTTFRITISETAHSGTAETKRSATAAT
jgi:hypothetical protein